MRIAMDGMIIASQSRDHQQVSPNDIAKAGDIQLAKSFATVNPEVAIQLGDAFARHNPGLLHLLQTEVPTAFASPLVTEQERSPDTSVNLVKPPDDGDGGGGGIPTEPPVIVTAPAPPPTPPPSFPSDPPPPPPPGGGGGGGGGGGNSTSFGNLNEKGDTTQHRMEIMNTAEADLAKLGYSFPAGYEIKYTDQFAFKNQKTGQYRYSDSRDPQANETEVFGRTDTNANGSGGNIYMFRGATEPPLGSDGFFHWSGVKMDNKGMPSMTGNVGTIVDGGMGGVQLTLAAMAHELYHAQGHFAANTNDPNDPTEIDANTYGLIAERALNAAAIAERNK